MDRIAKCMARTSKALTLIRAQKFFGVKSFARGSQYYKNTPSKGVALQEFHEYYQSVGLWRRSEEIDEF
jgi:hypothetical protein